MTIALSPSHAPLSAILVIAAHIFFSARISLLIAFASENTASQFYHEHAIFLRRQRGLYRMIWPFSQRAAAGRLYQASLPL